MELRNQDDTVMAKAKVEVELPSDNPERVARG